MSVQQSRGLTADEIEAYQRDGVVCLRGIYDQACVKFLAAVLDEFYASNSEQGSIVDFPSDRAIEQGGARAV